LAAWPVSAAAIPPVRKALSAGRPGQRPSAGVGEAEHRYVSQNPSWSNCYNIDLAGARSIRAQQISARPAAVGAKTRADTDMPFGHNSNVTVAGDTYYVQTEERGAAHALIDSNVYLRWRVLNDRANRFSIHIHLHSDRDQAIKLR